MRLSPERAFEEATAVPSPVAALDGASEASSLRFFRGRWSMSIAMDGSAGTWEILSSPRANGGVCSGAQVPLPGVPPYNYTLALRWRVGDRVGAKPWRSRGTAKRRKTKRGGRDDGKS